jgi:tetratricopeptide (TPR) repeat protein
MNEQKTVGHDSPSTLKHSDNVKYNYSIQEMSDALEIQKRKFGRHHQSITKSLHSLALEYKAQEKYDKTLQCLREALCILDERLENLMEEVKEEMEIQTTTDNNSQAEENHDKYGIIKENASKVTRAYMKHLLEEKSVMYACLGNIYKDRKMYKEAMDNYLQSLGMLVEADFSGQSPRVSMMVRIMKRAEQERKALG